MVARTCDPSLSPTSRARKDLTSSGTYLDFTMPMLGKYSPQHHSVRQRVKQFDSSNGSLTEDEEAADSRVAFLQAKGGDLVVRSVEPGKKL
eukprot:204460-Hanusia_phi.AAC.2